MPKVLHLGVAGGVGATLMFLLDPERGARRRAIAHDQIAHAWRKTRRFANAAGADLGNRLSGISARARRTRLDDVRERYATLERARPAIGRVVTHPGALHLIVDEEGAVPLDGAILASELSPLLNALRRVEGVSRIDNRLMVRQTSTGVPGLQGIGTAARPRMRHALCAPGVKAAAIFGSGVAVAVLIGALRARRRAARYEETHSRHGFSGPAYLR
jgi:hypothetical protein